MPSRRWTDGEVKRANDMRAARDIRTAQSIRRSDATPARRSKGLKLQATDRGIACTSHRATFQITFWLNATRLPPRASNAHLQEISVAIRRPVTRRYTARQGFDSAARRSCPVLKKRGRRCCIRLAATPRYIRLRVWPRDGGCQKDRGRSLGPH